MLAKMSNFTIGNKGIFCTGSVQNFNYEEAFKYVSSKGKKVNDFTFEYKNIKISKDKNRDGSYQYIMSGYGYAQNGKLIQFKIQSDSDWLSAGLNSIPSLYSKRDLVNLINQIMF